MAVQWSSEHEKQDALLLLCRDLISCVNKIMDPSSIQAERAECSQVGLSRPHILCQQDHGPLVHSGRESRV